MRKLGLIGSVGDGDEIVAGTMSTLPMDTGAIAAARRPDRRGAMGVQASEHVAYVQEEAQHLHQTRSLTIRALIGNQRRESLVGIESAHSRRCWCGRVFVLDDWDLNSKVQQ